LETQTLDLIVISGEPENEIRRSITLTNEEWSVLAMCTDAYADTFRTRHSQIIATYVTRGQLAEAQQEAVKMNTLLQKLDKIQAKLV
jgi:hypothetical protein